MQAPTLEEVKDLLSLPMERHIHQAASNYIRNKETMSAFSFIQKVEVSSPILEPTKASVYVCVMAGPEEVLAHLAATHQSIVCQYYEISPSEHTIDFLNDPDSDATPAKRGPRAQPPQAESGVTAGRVRHYPLKKGHKMAQRQSNLSTLIDFYQSFGMVAHGIVINQFNGEPEGKTLELSIVGPAEFIDKLDTQINKLIDQGVDEAELKFNQSLGS